MAEPLFSQQPRKLWIMSMAMLGKQVEQSSQSPRPKAGSDIWWCGLWARVEGGRRLSGFSSIGAGETLEVSIVQTECGALRGAAAGRALPVGSGHFTQPRLFPKQQAAQGTPQRGGLSLFSH